MCHDGFENLMLYNLNSNLLEDVLTERNCHQADICPMDSAKISKSNKSKSKLSQKWKKKGMKSTRNPKGDK